MKWIAFVAVLFLAPVLASAEGPKLCEDLRTEIAQKLDAKGVTGYSLEIVAKDKEAEGKVVGSCENGTKKIMYTKVATTEKAPAPQPKK